MDRITKKQKILYVIYKMSLGSIKNVRYEDILVESFKLFPKEFQIRYYPKYPDTDTIRRNLYQLIPDGFLKISQRKCVLTDFGISKGKELKELIEGTEIKKDERVDYIMQREINRLLYLQGFKMFINNRTDKIIERDFYEFYKVTVRTRNLEIKGNIRTIDHFISHYLKKEKVLGKRLEKYSSFLKSKFDNLIKEEN